MEGNAQTPDLNIFQGGWIHIELAHCKISYAPGEWIKGEIYVNQTELLLSTGLHLRFVGQEKSLVSKSTHK
jgi:hypothetical protein